MVALYLCRSTAYINGGVADLSVFVFFFVLNFRMTMQNKFVTSERKLYSVSVTD